MNRSERFFNSVKNKKTAVIGVGVSNTDLIKLFLKKGIDVTVCDRKSQKEMGETYEDLKEVGADFILGEKYLDSLCDFDIVVRAPGMYFNNPALIEARKTA